MRTTQRKFRAFRGILKQWIIVLLINKLAICARVALLGLAPRASERVYNYWHTCQGYKL